MCYTKQKRESVGTYDGDKNGKQEKNKTYQGMKVILENAEKTGHAKNAETLDYASMEEVLDDIPMESNQNVID